MRGPGPSQLVNDSAVEYPLQLFKSWKEDSAPGNNRTWKCVQGFCMIRAVKQWMNTQDYRVSVEYTEAKCKQKCLTTRGCTSFAWAPERHSVLAGYSCVVWLNYACDLLTDNGLLWCHSDSGKSAGAGWGCCRPTEKTKTCQLRRDFPVTTKPRWVPLHTLAGTTKISLTTGVVRETEIAKTIALSTTMKVSIGDPDVSGYGAETTQSLEQSFRQARSTSASSTFEVEFQAKEDEKYLWQWVFVTKMQDGSEIEDVGTKEYAVTAGRWEKPKCLPGYAKDAPRYQQCHGEYLVK